MTATAYTVIGVVLAGCIAYAASVPPCSERITYLSRAARYHLTRRRYARRMHGPLPDRDQGIPYDRRQWLAILDAWDAPPARPERTRT